LIDPVFLQGQVMSIPGYHSEWVTLGDNRVLLCCQSSFPDDRMKLMAQVAVETCRQNSTTERAGIVEVYFNDKVTVWTVTVASTDVSDKKIGPILQGVLQGMLDNGNVFARVLIVPKGDVSSDQYNHMEHLSIAAGVGTEEWTHEDEDLPPAMRAVQ
jgi:hypothetical protein